MSRRTALALGAIVGLLVVGGAVVTAIRSDDPGTRVSASGPPSPQPGRSGDPQPPRAVGGVWNLLIQESAGLSAGGELLYTLTFTGRPTDGDGWDVGGRAGYGCGFAELVVGGRVIADVVVEKYDRAAEGDGDELYSFINSDRQSEGHGREPCSHIGTAPGTVIPAQLGEPELDDDTDGASFGIVYHGEVAQMLSVPFRSPDHEDAWWHNGNEPGEALLFYREDESNDYGIVARLSINPVVDGVEVVDLQAPGATLPSLPSASSSSSASPNPSAELTPGDLDGSSSCTRVLGFSVTEQWFRDGGFEALVPDDRWELLASAGYDLHHFADPSDPIYHDGVRVQSSCGTPTRAFLQIAYLGFGLATNEQIAAGLSAALRNIRATWPTIEDIVVMPIVGGPNHAVCTMPDGREVDATKMHPPLDEVIADADGIVVGPDLLVSTCEHFRDGMGHLAGGGAAEIARQIADFVS